MKSGGCEFGAVFSSEYVVSVWEGVDVLVDQFPPIATSSGSEVVFRAFVCFDVGVSDAYRVEGLENPAECFNVAVADVFDNPFVFF